MCTVTSVRETPRNVWVSFEKGYPTSMTDPQQLVEMALVEVGHHTLADFPYGYDVRGFSMDRSAIVILHKVDPES